MDRLLHNITETHNTQNGLGSIHVLNITTDNFHNRTVHLDIIRDFYLPTDAQESFFCR
jgi:hypothetical protein